jgi:hypothetical protein
MQPQVSMFIKRLDIPILIIKKEFGSSILHKIIPVPRF